MGFGDTARCKFDVKLDFGIILLHPHVASFGMDVEMNQNVVKETSVLEADAQQLEVVAHSIHYCLIVHVVTKRLVALRSQITYVSRKDFLIVLDFLFYGIHISIEEVIGLKTRMRTLYSFTEN